jgi:ubiquinol-cytochrome c reductase cytochrome b/c1 subunit
MPVHVVRSAIVRGVDYRLPVFTFIDHELIDYPTPRNLNYWWNFGSLAGITLVIMIISGRLIPLSQVGQYVV